MVKIGIIGGSGLYKINELENARDVVMETIYGTPSSPLKVGKIHGIDVVFLSRHGLEHTITPTHVNNRANIQALKEIGCTHILATTACGSLKREIGRGHLVILDQFIDFTKHRNNTFFDSFKPHEHGHTAMATPFNREMRNKLIETAKELGIVHHEKGTMITIEGPRFSTKAESKMFALWGADVINMSTAPEAALANEAKIPYAAVAMATDYDCLFDDVPPVTHEDVLKVFSENVGKVIKLYLHVIPKIGGK
jgi:5'-methylthioadenosine phosphorylase